MLARATAYSSEVSFWDTDILVKGIDYEHQKETTIHSCEFVRDYRVP